MKRIFRFRRLCIHPAFFITIFALFFADSSVYSLAFVFCAFFHELGHICAIYLLGLSVSKITLLPFGVEISILGNLGYKKELIIALCGPLFGFFLSGTLFLVCKFYPCALLYFSYICSLWLSLLNLLPLPTLDGSRALKSIFFLLFDYEKALMLVRASELLSLILLSAFCAISVIFSSYNLSLCAICIMLFFSVCRRQV